MTLGSKLKKAAKDPYRTYERIAKLTTGFVRGLLPREKRDDIVMFHIGRSGSTVLGDMLDQHPRIYWDGEVYDPVAKGRSLGTDPLTFLSKRMRRAGRRLYGCEVKPVHMHLLDLEPGVTIDCISELGFSRFIVLERRNYLRKVVSSAIAHETGSFHRGASEDRTRSQITLDVENIRIDRDEKPLLGFLESYDQFFRSLREYLDGKRLLWITYEDDVFADPRVGYEKICSFIGVEPLEGPAVRYGKTNPYPLKEIVNNFSDLEGVLKGTTYEWMLYDGSNRREDQA